MSPASWRRADEIAIAGLGEELDDGLGDARADLVDGFEFVGGRGHEGVDGAEVLREELGGALADEAYAEAKQNAVERSGFGALDLVEECPGGLFADAIEAEEVFFLEVVEIGERADEDLSAAACRGHGFGVGDRLLFLAHAFIDGGGGLAEKLRDHGVAEPLDVHDAAGGEVEELFAKARGAVGVDAPPVDLALGADELARALGAVGGEDDLDRAARVLLVGDDLDDLGDDVAAALDLDEVADADAEPGDLVGVVEGGATDCGASDVARGRARRRA